MGHRLDHGAGRRGWGELEVVAVDGSSSGYSGCLELALRQGQVVEAGGEGARRRRRNHRVAVAVRGRGRGLGLCQFVCVVTAAAAVDVQGCWRWLLSQQGDVLDVLQLRRVAQESKGGDV